MGDVQKLGNSATKAKNKYNAKNYDRLNLVVPKGRKQVIEDISKRLGKSLNGYVNDAIDEQIKRDTTE